MAGMGKWAEGRASDGSSRYYREKVEAVSKEARESAAQGHDAAYELADHVSTLARAASLNVQHPGDHAHAAAAQREAASLHSKIGNSNAAAKHAAAAEKHERAAVGGDVPRDERGRFASK